jgi:hypothetical protein
MTYNTNLDPTHIIEQIRLFSEKYNIRQMFPGDNTKYRTQNPITTITVLNDRMVQISNVGGRKRDINKTVSKLLKMVNGLILK